MSETLDINLIRQEGWDTPAAEYWKERAEAFALERDAARAEIRRLWCALKLETLHIENVERAYHPVLRRAGETEKGEP